MPTTILQSAGGITAWDAYLYGLDASHTETLREQSNFPSLGTLPYVGSGMLRFGGRTNLNYNVAVKTQSPTVPWVPQTPTITVTTNGWNEYRVTNSGPMGLFRIGAGLR